MREKRFGDIQILIKGHKIVPIVMPKPVLKITKSDFDRLNRLAQDKGYGNTDDVGWTVLVDYGCRKKFVTVYEIQILEQ